MKKKQPNLVQNGKQIKKTNKKWLVLNVCFALIFVSALTAIYFSINNKTPNNKTEAVAKTVSSSTKKASTEATKLIQSGDTASAAKVYSEAVKNTSSQDEKVTLLLSKAAIYFDDDDFENALAATKEALAVKEVLGVDDLLGRIYYEIGDLKNSITYYQKAMALLNKSSLTYKSDLADYQKIIDDIQIEIEASDE